MNLHKNARQTPPGRERWVRLVPSGLSLVCTPPHYGVDESSATKLVGRYLKTRSLDPLPMGRRQARESWLHTRHSSKPGSKLNPT